MAYRAPVPELAFALSAMAGVDRLMGEGGGFPELDADTVQAVLEAAGQLAEGVIGPLNREGDRVGSRLENGRVVTPPGFKDAFRAFAEGGWNGLSADAEYGGQGLPRALHLAMFEMVHGANMAFALAPTLTAAAIEALIEHGDDRQKRVVLPKLISGEWAGTMNLTEPQAGSDLGLVRTRAEPDGQGGYRLTGEKIFITWGDHDCADNIAHLVLARLPDAPAGVKGISLFLALRRKADAEGNLREANALRVGSLEHKLGIHASPTCVMLFEGAEAELVGRPNEGLAHMFTMMNAARLNVGVQGVGVAEAAFQHALAYAGERRQGRSPWSPDAPARIVDHPDIRRRLAVVKAKIQAARGICLSAAVAADLSRTAADEGLRAAARRREDLLTPIAKGWSTDLGVEAASEGVQVHGGMGFIEETGAPQYYRDARIAPIYEGTNAIQAMDLVGRKLAADKGRAMGELVADIRETVSGLGEGPLKARLAAGTDALERAAGWLVETGGTADALAGATPFLELAGRVTGGWMLAKAAAADPGRAGLAALYAEHVLAGVPALAETVQAGAGVLETLSAEALAS